MARLRVVTLNIWNRQGPWEQRLPLLRAGMKRLDPDLVGLQEVLEHEGRSQAHEIAEGLGLHVAFGLAHDLGNGFNFGNAVLSRWPITSSAAFALPTGESQEHRAIVMAKIASPHGEIPFFTTHLNWKFHEGIIREKQVLAIASVVKREAPTSTTANPPIVVGDFNAEPEASEVRFMKGLQSLEGNSTFFGDCFSQCGEGPGFTYDAKTNPFAAPTHEYPRRIDYVFVRGPMNEGRGKPVAAQVVFDEKVDGICATDHYGVLAEIEL